MHTENPTGAMKADIENATDIRTLINAFYEKVKADRVIGYLFNDIAQVNWEHHLPVMYDFWETMLFDAGKYTRNAMEPHFRLNALEKLRPEHFERWLTLFNETLDEYFAGPKCALAKTRAGSIAGIMSLKMDKINALDK
jgi:hemoglobin